MANITTWSETLMSCQNIYDNPEFFAAYRELRLTASGLNEVLEQPALEAMLPKTLEGIRVLDVGCGFGDFVRKLAAQGVAHVLGIDISESMLAEAKNLTDDERIEYRRMAVEHLEPESQQVDLVVSSLVLHYVQDYRAAVLKIAATLKMGGLLVFSVEHPICTASAEQRWILDETGNPRYWPIDNYRAEGRRETKWFVDGVVKYHRTIESYLLGLLNAGFSIESFSEPEPTAEAIVQNPNLRLHCRRPPFLVIAARKMNDVQRTGAKLAECWANPRYRRVVSGILNWVFSGMKG
jgi:2-polyprenyl-3-methyl-5-hydroxy-6-metoxy-1,4-benzoquinol methylase